MMGRELKSYPCARLNYNQIKMTEKTRPRRKTLLNPSVKSVTALIKNKCIVGLAKQRSMIKNRKLNSLIKPCSGGKKLNSKDPNGSFTNKRELNYPFTPVNLHILFKKSRDWIKLASHKKETKPSISTKTNISSNKNVFANRITYFIRLVSYSMKVKSFIPDKPSVLINKSALENQVIYSRSKKYFFIPIQYVVINKGSSIMKIKPIYRLGKKYPSRSLFISEKDPRNSASCISQLNENQLMVKEKEVR